MDTNKVFPEIVEPQQLLARIDYSHICIIDLCKRDTYDKGHVPGAIHLEYNLLDRADPPAMGLLPDINELSNIVSTIGLTPETHVVAYDDEGGGKAARFLWTLDVIGHPSSSLLNGGIHAWLNEGYPFESTAHTGAPTTYRIKHNTAPIADRHYVLQNLHNDAVTFLDARSRAEYTGEKKFALHGGHIPGAVNLDWLMMIDRDNNLRLQPKEEIRNILQSKNISRDKTIVNYCQTNHRSALVYYVLKALKFPHIKAYPGSWSDWGNSNNTPIETRETSKT